jgi:hypothetical protein
MHTNLVFKLKAPQKDLDGAKTFGKKEKNGKIQGKSLWIRRIAASKNCSGSVQELTIFPFLFFVSV